MKSFSQQIRIYDKKISQIEADNFWGEPTSSP